MNRILVLAFALTAGIMGFSSVTNASAIVISGTCHISDVTFENTNSDACVGVNSGNIADTWGAAIIDGYFGASWSYLTASNAGGTGTFNGIQFNLGGNNTGTSGNWTLSWADTNGATPANLPYWIDLAIVVKAGNGYAAYLFDDLLLAAAPDNSGAGSWDVAVQNYNVNNGNTTTPGLSHLGLYVRAGTCQVNCENLPPEGGGNPIPEPETLALLGIGLLGIRASIKRKTQR